MEKIVRPDPIIPDHDVLRKIGGGAYGEVWLARAVTGTMRAVKIVYREDFSDENTFEREFKGILKFEPISRDHPGLVHVLHVGRSDVGESPFYYYVMELGDDVYAHDEFNPVEYEPRTLRTDMKMANGTPLDTDFCIETGRRLADGLSHLHGLDLTHRDVKPSNVIFVEGNAKLADIGLVAAKDQRTFVGTEGFLPPEGPGSVGADVYGLGKVLYEMATGMDRLQFPELPEEGPPEKQRKKWILLNRVICDVCEPRLAKRKIKSASELAEILGRLKKGRRPARKISPLTGVAALMMFLFALVVGQVWMQYSWGMYDIEGKREPLPIRYITAKISSVSEDQTVLEGVDAYDTEDTWLGATPVRLENLVVGERLRLVLKKTGFRDAIVDEEIIDDGTQSMFIPVDMVRFSPPVEEEDWQDALGLEYVARDERHISVSHIDEASWKIFSEAEKIEEVPEVFENSEAGEKIKIVAVPEELARRYAEWLTLKCLNEGFLAPHSNKTLEGNREIRAVYDRKFPEERLSERARQKGWRPFHCLVQVIPYATMTFGSTPEGASVYINGEWVGETNLTNYVILPGLVNYAIELEGYQTYEGSVVLNDRAHEDVFRNLKENQGGVVFGKNARVWKNSLGMRFAPLGDDLMVSIWQTRSSDYEAFLEAKQRTLGPEFVAESKKHPAVGMNRTEAMEFCEWLTTLERDRERIQKQHRYRLLTDLEWSRAVGLMERMEQPAQRDNDIQNARIYPWGTDIWPPPDKVGNYADQVAANDEDTPLRRTVEGYIDGYQKASPVGSFPPNERGFYDLGGNVKEWVSDNYKEGGDGEGYGVLRGADWRSYDDEHLELRHRDFVAPASRGETYGFRVVLAKEEEQEQKDLDTEIEDDGGDTD